MYKSDSCYSHKLRAIVSVLVALFKRLGVAGRLEICASLHHQS